MEAPRERPPDYVLHDPTELRLPSVPQHDLVSPPHRPADLTLPALSSVLAGLPAHGQAQHAMAYDSQDKVHNLHTDRLAALERQGLGRGLPSIVSPALLSGSLPGRMSSEFAGLRSPTDTASVMSVDDMVQRSTSNISLEDPDVRAAAEALSLFSGFSRHSKAPSQGPSHTTAAPVAPAPLQSDASEPADEPILSLLVETHPWVGGTINGSLSAYQTTKHFTPRFVQNGATFIERSVVNTVGAIGHHTGVESGIRSYLGNRRTSDAWKKKDLDGQRKRSHEELDAMDIEHEPYTDDPLARTRYDYLPAYRQSKPPSYREEASPADIERGVARPQQTRSWSNRFLVSTSGLGVALSEGSLKSLTYCTRILSKGTRHVELVLDSLKLVLQDYQRERSRVQHGQGRLDKELEAGIVPQDVYQQDRAARDLANRIENLCFEIWQTLQTVVDQLTKYAGAALPDNAKQLVKGQLLSIPNRWRWASEQAEASSADQPTQAANRMIAFASEGLDVMGQVNGVMQLTLNSAEDWLKTFGRLPPRRAQLVPSDYANNGGAPARQSRPELSANHEAIAGADMHMVDGTPQQAGYQ